MAAVGVVNKRSLEVVVKAANGLKGVDFGGKCCPFVELIIRDRGTLKKTSEKMDTVDPAWNETFQFEVVDEIDDVLAISVMAHKKLESNVLLGVVSVPVAMCVTSPEPITRAFELKELHNDHKNTQGSLELTLTWTDSEGVQHVHSGVPLQGEHPRVHAQREKETSEEYESHREEYEKSSPHLRERREREESEGRGLRERRERRRRELRREEYE